MDPGTCPSCQQTSAGNHDVECGFIQHVVAPTGGMRGVRVIRSSRRFSMTPNPFSTPSALSHATKAARSQLALRAQAACKEKTKARRGMLPLSFLLILTIVLAACGSSQSHVTHAQSPLW